MKQLLKRIKQISMLLLVISLIGCENEDTILPEVISSFTHTINADTGTVTFINTSVNSKNYFWTFGDGTSSTEIDPVKTFTTGEYKVTLKATNVAGASDTSEDIIVISDAGAPVITLIGDPTINITVGGTYDEPGATAEDDVDGDISTNIVVGGATVDVNTAGTYIITYNVSDAAGNTATQRTRTVIVAADIVKPVITLLGETTINLMVGVTYDDEGATAEDDVDGDITDNIVVVGVDAVDVNTAGTYVITYNVSDAAGNEADEVTRTVIVTDGNAYNYPDASDVISVYSDLYTDIANTNFDPDWGQGTVVSEVDSDGGKAMLYTGLDYQGINLGDTNGVPQDFSGKKYLHIEYKTANATALNVFLIGGVETSVALDVSSSEWQKVDILLTEFTGVNLAVVNQMKFVGNGDVLIDNIFFHGTADGGGVTGDYVYATSETATIVSTIANWDSGTTIIDDYSGDATYNPCIQATKLGAGWGTAVAFTSIEAGKILEYSTLDFKIKTTDFTTIKVKIPGSTNEELTFTIANGTALADGWVQMSIALSEFGTIPTGITEFAILMQADGTMLITDVMLSGVGSGGGGGGGTGSTAPTVAAPTPPARNAADVISIFSNEYTDITVSEWGTSWDSADVVDVQIEGNDTKKITYGNFLGVDFSANSFDATGMTHFHIDYFVAEDLIDNMVFIPKLSNHTGGAGETNAFLYTELVTATGTWVSIDVAISAMDAQATPPATDATATDNIAQLILSTGASIAGAVYVDNIYLYK